MIIVTIAHCFSRSWEHPQRRRGRGSWRTKTLWPGTSHCMKQSHSVCMHQGGRDHNDVIQLHMCIGALTSSPYSNCIQFACGFLIWMRSNLIFRPGSVLILILHMLGWFSTHTLYAGLVQYSYSYSMLRVHSVVGREQGLSQWPLTSTQARKGGSWTPSEAVAVWIQT